MNYREKKKKCNLILLLCHSRWPFDFCWQKRLRHSFLFASFTHTLYCSPLPLIFYFILFSLYLGGVYESLNFLFAQIVCVCMHVRAWEHSTAKHKKNINKEKEKTRIEGKGLLLDLMIVFNIYGDILHIYSYFK